MQANHGRVVAGQPAAEREAATGIVGLGHVGRGLRRLFPESGIYDTNPELGLTNRSRVNACEVAFVCVPTPRLATGHADLRAVETVVGWLEADIIVIKSTVTPGTTDRLRDATGKRIVFSPEYIGEWPETRGFEFSPEGWPFTVIGGPAEDCDIVLQHFGRRLGADHRFIRTDARTSELAKYMENAWLALQVIFADHFADMAEALGISYFGLRDLWAADPRVSAAHTLVDRDDPGFAGRCLPKDLDAITKWAVDAGLQVELLQAAAAANLRIRATGHARATPTLPSIRPGNSRSTRNA
jgi:UDPglucose 6-dehydrogenase